MGITLKDLNAGIDGIIFRTKHDAYYNFTSDAAQVMLHRRCCTGDTAQVMLHRRCCIGDAAYSTFFIQAVKHKVTSSVHTATVELLSWEKKVYKSTTSEFPMRPWSLWVGKRRRRLFCFIASSTNEIGNNGNDISVSVVLGNHGLIPEPVLDYAREFVERLIDYYNEYGGTFQPKIYTVRRIDERRSRILLI